MKQQTRNRRITQYKTLVKQAKRQEIVRSTQGEVGLIVGEAPAYTGEAGYSERARVLWRNGDMTFCAYQGMFVNRQGEWEIHN